jgi:hypothetical protein
VERLASYGKAVLARRIDDAGAVARATGTSMGQAKKTVETGAALREAPEVGSALASGEISFDQAGEIAKPNRRVLGRRRSSTAASASTAATGSDPNAITSNPAMPVGRPRPPTSSGAAIHATRRKPNATAWRAS